MPVDDTKEKRIEEDIESFLISSKGGWTKTTDTYIPADGLWTNTLIAFIKRTQPKEWARFEKQNATDPVKKFCNAFSFACSENGLINVLRHGFKHRGITFKVCYFKPESHLNKTAQALYEQNICNCVRQWKYSDANGNSVDMVLAVNGIPVFALELKNQFTGQDISNAKTQWMYDRDPKEVCFRFNNRILAYFCVDQTDVAVATKLDKGNTYFLPFNQGSNGAGIDGGAGNPANPDGYMTSYLWEDVLQKDSALDIIQKFIQLQGGKLIFPRFHQLDAVRKLIAHVKATGAGTNYLIQHSAGSGKSNTIAWTAYRLASLHDDDNKPIFASVIIVTDRTVLDAQLQETVSSFDATLGTVETIGEGKTSKDLRDAINNGSRIIVTTLQKFPFIYTEVENNKGKNYAVIVDEAHSSQTGASAAKLKAALANTEDALREYAEIEGIAEDEIDPDDKLINEMKAHGKHKNLTFCAYTATPKGQTLEMFGTPHSDGSYHPFHVYSMRQAIEEGFIMDVLQNYMTYKTSFEISKAIEDNPDVPASRAAKIIKKFADLHPYNIAQKAAIIVETFLSTTMHSINGKGKMMVVTSSRLAAVRYYHEIKRYCQEKIAEGHPEYDNVAILAAFSGTVKDGTADYTEESINVRRDGTHITEAQTKKEFNDNFRVLVVADKYGVGFDQPLLHTMIVDKKLRSVKCVQTLSRLNRIHPEKHDTFILDFVNTVDDIKDAFQPFYQETSLTSEVNVDKIYTLQKELRAYNIYSDNDILAFSSVYFSKKKQDGTMLGKMASALKPVADRYNDKDDKDDRYNFRRQVRSFVKWYGYISQVCRMFDKEMHQEYVFLSYLIKLLPQGETTPLDLEGALRLEFFKLETTYKGDITLEKVGGEWEPAEGKGKGSSAEKKSPLEEVIDKINELYAGEFTEADKVILNALHDKLMGDKKLRQIAKKSEPKIFMESIFPKTFNAVAQDSYVEQTEAYSAMFQDQSKYKAFMSALAKILYNEFNA